MDKRVEDIVERIRQSFRKDYMVIGTVRARGWQVWLFFGIAVGIGLVFLATVGPGGSFFTGQAKVITQGAASSLLQKAADQKARIELAATRENFTIPQLAYQKFGGSLSEAQQEFSRESYQEIPSLVEKALASFDYRAANNQLASTERQKAKLVQRAENKNVVLSQSALNSYAAFFASAESMYAAGDYLATRDMAARALASVDYDDSSRKIRDIKKLFARIQNKCADAGAAGIQDISIIVSGMESAYAAGDYLRVYTLSEEAKAKVADVNIPTIQLTSPAASATVAGQVQFAAEASDNFCVASVTFFVDGTKVGKDSSAPYTFSWNSIVALNGAHIVSAKSIDNSGNVSIGAGVSVQVQNTIVSPPPVAPPPPIQPPPPPVSPPPPVQPPPPPVSPPPPPPPVVHPPPPVTPPPPPVTPPPPVPPSTFSPQGFGSQTVGGNNGTVVRVTNLNDAGAGSLRDAISGGNRKIVFDVGGDIILLRDLVILKPFVTVDGSTAPSPGVTIKNYGFIIHGTPRYNSGAEAHDVIIKNIRIRNADNDGIGVGWGAYNVLVDHVSASDSGDGNIDITHGAHDVTVQWSLIGPSSVGKNMLIKRQTADAPGETNRVTLHHNAIITSSFRNPRISNGIQNTASVAADTTVDMRNNIVFNWKTGLGTDVECGAKANIVQNFYSDPGIGASDQAQAVVVRGEDAKSIANSCQFGADAHVFGNFSADNLSVDINTNPEEVHHNNPTPFAAPALTTTSPCSAARQVIQSAGALPHDTADQGLFNQITVPASCI